MTKEVSIKCTGEKIQVKHVGEGYYVEVLNMEIVQVNNSFEKYGRRFHYSKLNFENEKKY